MYSGEPVTQLQHALQTAALAEAAGADDALITASLLHDLGHLLQDFGDTPTLRGVDDIHQYAALPFLRGLFGERVLGSIRLHVDAKRYLCAVRPDYHAALSADSQRSLKLQGGVFDAAQAAAFIAQPGAEGAVQLRAVGRPGEGRAGASRRRWRTSWPSRRVAGSAGRCMTRLLQRARARAAHALLTLTWPVIAAVLCGALLHAGWNAFVKSSATRRWRWCWCTCSAAWARCRCCCGWACRGPRPGPTSPRRW